MIRTLRDSFGAVSSHSTTAIVSSTPAPAPVKRSFLYPGNMVGSNPSSLRMPSHLSTQGNLGIQKTLVLTVACQVLCHACSCLTKRCQSMSQLMKLSRKFSLVKSHATLVVDQETKVHEKTLMQTLSCQLSCNSCFCLTRT